MMYDSTYDSVYIVLTYLLLHADERLITDVALISAMSVQCAWPGHTSRGNVGMMPDTLADGRVLARPGQTCGATGTIGHGSALPARCRSPPGANYA